MVGIYVSLITVLYKGSVVQGKWQISQPYKGSGKGSAKLREWLIGQSYKGSVKGSLVQGMVDMTSA